MITTTLNAIRDKSPCENGWKKLLAHLGKRKADNEPLSLLTILESNGLDDALWCLRAVEGHDREIRLLACDFAERALRFVPEGEDRPRKAIETSRMFAEGKATEEELNSAWDDAWDAARDAAWDAEADAGAAWAARAAVRAADVWAAAWAAARAAARAAAKAAARAAAEASSWATAVINERAEQEKMFKAWLE